MKGFIFFSGRVGSFHSRRCGQYGISGVGDGVSSAVQPGHKGGAASLSLIYLFILVGC